MAHRMMEYSACGTPVITRKRPEIDLYFNSDEIFTYSDRNELLNKVKNLIRHPDYLKKVGNVARNKCAKQHNITHRVDNLISELNTILGEQIF